MSTQSFVHLVELVKKKQNLISMRIEKEYIDWLQANFPDADHTIDLTRDYCAQESRDRLKQVVSKIQSVHTAIARGSEDDYDDWNNNQSWSDFSRTIRG